MNVLPSVANTLSAKLVAKASGSPITSGTVNFYLRAKSGDNAGKWFRGSDSTWQAAEALALAGTHVADGGWDAAVPAAAWIDGVQYAFYAKESGGLHIPVGENTFCSAAFSLASVVAAAQSIAASVTRASPVNITQSDLEEYFGESNVAKWSNVENDDAGADTGKITNAIVYGEEYVADRFRDGPYTVPFVATGSTYPAVLLHWMTIFAGAYLYEARGMQDESEDNKITKLKETADAQMAEYLSGQRRLSLQKSSSINVTAPAMAGVSSPGVF